MSKSFLPAVVAAIALAVGGLSANEAWSQAAPKISPSLAKTFKAAQEAQQAGKWADVISKAQEALASPNRKPDDTYYANYLLFAAYKAQNNMPEVTKALEGQVNSGFLSPEQQQPLIKALMSLSFQSKDYDKAVDYGTRLTKGGGADPEVFTTIGQSYYLQGKYGDAARFLNSLINEQEKRGQTPREQNLQLLQSSYDKLGNKDAASDALEKLVVYYPKPAYWDALLYSVRNIPALDSRQKLHVYRLMRATGTLKQAADYSKFSEYAYSVGLPAEAASVLDAGLKANVFTDANDKSRAERQSASYAKAADTDKAGLAKRDTEAQAAATGELDVALGMVYYSYGDFDKSVAALQRGIGKGGLKNTADAQLLLGEAQLKANAKADALKTFKGIKSDDANTQRVANMWTLYAS